MKPVILDLFCKAGGCSVGYHRAGFEVIGVDIEPQPRYPFRMVVADALRPPFDLSHFDAVHASPPCQKYSKLRSMHPGREYPDLLDATRKMLKATGKPYVIENVEGAPMDKHDGLFGHGVVLCGSMFGLGVSRGYLRRHRCFETNFPVPAPRCKHRGPAVGVYGHGGHSGKHRMLYRQEASEAMGIDWMTRDEMCQAVPPAYTEHIGRSLMRLLESI